ncbi:aminopeptidase N [Microbacterium sp. MPKO10]|uniref:aminopeptidase N n=1 Tax=Microbacterium sp. MPKO10 TaxID=2989818 RepID=UPI00223599BC|nr:aminopeptidase N [Microbacterium sp. MPKO10]MCW4460050.1 aminopeptidase N [Microbacterium sp. MPKO10]
MSSNASANLSRSETAARSAALTLHTARVELDLRRAPDAAARTFLTTTTLEFDADLSQGDSTWVDFIGENVEKVTLNGKGLPVQYDGARIQIAGLAASNSLTIVGNGVYSRSGEGLHRFVDPVDGETYLYTQYEPADSRRVMACFEQPDMKARFTFTVHAPAGWQVLSNQARATNTTSADAAGARHATVPAASARTSSAASQTVEFEPTLPISSYITAVAAGPYHRVDAEWTRGEQTVPLGVLCRASLAEHLDADEIIEVTRQGLDFFTDSFDYAYPWGKYDQIFVPEYNLGAMENPGLVTFAEGYVFRGASTDAQHEGRANTLLHEMAHMWFGDLVTMQWWDDLWLKESFADYMGALAAAEATRFSEAWVTFANRRKAWAYLQDQLPTTHPIVADIVDLEAAKLNFDGITYAKGAAVLKQLVAFVGRDAFFEGARRYFREHAFGNTTLDDLLVQLEETSGRDVRAWSRAWLETTGVSTLAIETDAAGQRHITQTAAPGEQLRPHRLAVAEYDLVDDRLVLRDTVDLEIDGERTPLAARGSGADAAGTGSSRSSDAANVHTSPTPNGSRTGDAALTLLNAGDDTYAKVRLDARGLAAVERALGTLEDSLARGIVWSALWNATRDGELAASRYLEIVRRFAPNESNVGLLTSVLANAAFTVTHYVADASRPAERRAWLEATWSGAFEAAPGSGHQLAWARALASASAYDDARAESIRGILDGTGDAPEGLPLDAELRWMLVTALAATGQAAEEQIDDELTRDNTSNGVTAHREALAARPDQGVKDAAWLEAWTNTSLSNDHLDATIHGFRAAGRRELIAAYDAEYFDRIRDAWQTRSIEIARRLVLGLFPADESLERVDAWLDANADAPAALVRLVREQRDHLARDLRVRAAQ